MKQLLEKLGFSHVRGIEWIHVKTLVKIRVSRENTPEDIVGKLLEAGEEKARKQMRKALGITE